MNFIYKNVQAKLILQFFLLFNLLLTDTAMANETYNNITGNSGIIDDRSSGDLTAGTGTQWRLLTDRVMGGISAGSLTLENVRGRNCLRIRGDVSTENNGGFVQIALDLSTADFFDASAYSGVEFVVAGNNETYNLHIRTDGLWFPWQSYRASFKTTEDWQTIKIPFNRLKAYKTTRRFDSSELIRVGLVAIGRNFQADLCLADIRFYTVQ